MIPQNTQRLIINYLNQQATLSERNELELWLDNANNYKIFKEYVKINSLIDVSMDMFDTNESKKKLLALIHKEKKQLRLRKYVKIVKYAAVVILFIGIGYYYQQDFFTNDIEVNNPIENITLQLENGTIIILNEDATSKIVDANGTVLGSQEENQLVYNNENKTDKLVYNTLNVPYGKRFKVKLSDGTIVNLNAGTSLKYPIHFIKGENRQVFLKGEAYFNVTKDTDHPFIVNANQLDVRVLGTQFNITSYAEDEYINTVLVEGSVSLYNKNTTYNHKDATVLKPGFKASWEKKTSEINIEEADIEMATAWINGEIIFRHMPFDKIIKKLERHYDVEITNNNSSLGKDIITASFDEETIEEVLKVINEVHPINYTIVSNKITIE